MCGPYYTSPTSPVATKFLTARVIRIEQKFGPHMLQKWLAFAWLPGSVLSWNSIAFSGSSDSANWSFQRKSKRARERASSRNWAAKWPFARSAAWAASL